MKKILFFASALAGLFFAASCQQEEFAPVEESNVVTFEVGIPEVATKAAVVDNGDNINDLVYAVYRTDATSLEAVQADKSLLTLLYQKNYADDETTFVTVNGKQSAYVPVELLNNGQNFVVVFWAQVEDKWVGEDFDLLNGIGYPAGMDANNSDFAAFTGISFLKSDNLAAKKSIELKRPFAQINVASTLPAQIKDVVLSTSTVKVMKAGKKFDVINQVASETETVEFIAAELPDGNLTVAGNTYKYIAMNYVFASGNVEVEYTINTDAHGTIQNTVSNVPVAANYRTNIVGSLLTSTADYTVTLAEFDTPSLSSYVNVTTTEEIDNALKADEEVISITLGADVSLTANDAYLALGGPDTKKIIIDGKKIDTRSGAEDYYTLNLSTNYWSRLNTVNPDATIVLKNLNLTSSQPTGTWNSYDVTFKCNVELENVNLLKALALDGVDKTAVLKNVTITESHDYYALWIAASGQTVSLEDVTINSLGRGIKIDDQYVGENTKLVTLNVDGLKVKSAKKAAIMVKTPEGAHITLNDVDITEVAEDNANEVWIDEDASSYINKVTVAGGSMIVEGQETINIDSMETLKSELEAAGAAGAGYTVLEISSDIDMTGQEWTPIKVDGYNGADIVTIDGKGHSIKGLTSSLFAGGFAGGSGIVIKNLTIEDANMIATNTQGYGAFVNCADAMDVITLINCHLKNSTITTPNNGQGESRIGGLVGWTAGYNNQNDGPVDSYITIQDCSVTGCTFTGWGSIGGICGHAGANAATFTTIENCTIKNNKFISTDDGGWRTGVVVGTANNGQCVIKNITESGNTLTQESASDVKNPKGIKRNYVGRFVPSGTGHLTIDGVEIEAGYWPFAEGMRTNEKENRYEITAAEGLTSFGKLVNEAGMYFSGETVVLTTDVDLNNEEWTPIGSAYKDHGFMGNFDGNGKTIKNLTMTKLTPDADEYVYAGLFGVTEGTETQENYIKNLVIENVTIETTGHIAAAAIAYPYYTTVENITVKGKINIKGGDYTSGALAYTRRCVNAKDITVAGNEGSTIEGKTTVGGVISDIQMNGGLTASYSNFIASGLTIKADKNVGGISGIISNQTLDGAKVMNVTLESTDPRTGIVAGALGEPSTIKNIITENVNGATNLVGATYDNGAEVYQNGDKFTAQN